MQHKDSGDINRFGLAMQVSDERNRVLVIERNRTEQYRERERERERERRQGEQNTKEEQILCRSREREWI